MLIYHYHQYEHTHVKKLFEKYPDQAITMEELLDRFIDLHRVITKAFVLPLEGYGLKVISKWLDFEYRNPKSNAAMTDPHYRYAACLTSTEDHGTAPSLRSGSGLVMILAGRC